MGAAQWTMLIVLSVLWGGSFFFVEIAVAALPPLTVVTLRVALAALALWLFALASGRPVPRRAGVWGALFGMGVLNNVIPFSLIAWAQTEIASGLASILNATTPLFTVLVATLLLADERAGPGRIAGMAIGFSGVVLIVGPSALAGLGGAGLAQLAVLAGALSYALAGVFGRRFRALGLDPVVTAAGQVTASALLLAPIGLAPPALSSLAAAGPDIWLALAGLAILSTALAYVLYFRILAEAGATNLLLVTFLIPVSAIGLGAVVLAERLAPAHFAGMAVIGAGLLLIDGRVLRRAPRRPR